MKTKKEIKKTKLQEKQKKARKDKVILYTGITIFVLAVIQVCVLIYYLNFFDRTPSNIILGNKVVTSEVCTGWFDAAYKENHTTQDYFYYEEVNIVKGINANHAIPLTIVEKVCNRWQKVKEDLDKNE